MVEVNWSLIIAGVLAAVLVLGKGGSLLDALKAILASITGGSKAAVPLQTNPQATANAALPTVEQRLAAIKLLRDFYSAPEVNCEKAIEAVAVCLDHALDDLKPHADKK